MTLERLTLRQNGQVVSKNTNLIQNVQKLISVFTPNQVCADMFSLNGLYIGMIVSN